MIQKVFQKIFLNSKETSFDQRTNIHCPMDRIQFNLSQKKITEKVAQSLGLITQYQGKKFPTNGAVLLLAEHHTEFFSDAIVKIGRFSGFDKSKIIDQKFLDCPLVSMYDQIIMFIQKYTNDVVRYPEEALNEAIINALVHADYSAVGTSITIAIYDDRIEITNPGRLTFGLTLEAALSGISLLRNKLIGRVFRELNLIEQTGSGLNKIIGICKHLEIKEPKIEEIGNFFRVTIYKAL